MAKSLLPLAAWFLISSGSASAQDARKPAGVVALFEDDAEGLLKLLTNEGDGGGQAEPEANIVFSGKKSLKVTHYQRFQRRLPGWNYAIRAKPNAGEYRYLRLAWRADGTNCLMLQLHDATDWHIRYVAGENPYGWQSRIVTNKAPGTWRLVTIDLFQDFGERTLTGIAFTINGGAGYFDHVYLGRSIADLDKIDAGGLADQKVALEKDDLERLWQDLVADDAAKQYRAYWTFIAGRQQSEAFLKAKTGPAEDKDAESMRIRGWIRDLDSENFATRQKATAELKKNIELAVSFLEAELAAAPAQEVRRRIETLLADAPQRDNERTRREKTQQILDQIVARRAM